MKPLRHISRRDLEVFVSRIMDAMYATVDDDEHETPMWDPDKEVNGAGLVDAVTEQLVALGLRPDALMPAWPDPLERAPELLCRKCGGANVEEACRDCQEHPGLYEPCGETCPDGKPCTVDPHRFRNHEHRSTWKGPEHCNSLTCGSQDGCRCNCRQCEAADEEAWQ